MDILTEKEQGQETGEQERRLSWCLIKDNDFRSAAITEVA